jgi:2-desacetyl-2-hydroxyethyl bacteriochlorophyllide A dehydrogenase
MQVKVAVLVRARTFEIDEVELPPLDDRQVLVKVLSCGLCHSEIPTYLGRSQSKRRPGTVETYGKMLSSRGLYAQPGVDYPVLLGHEPVGVVVDRGKAVKDLDVGDIVSGKKTPVVFGCYADHFLSGTERLLKLPQDLEKPEYCLLEPLQCVVTILRAALPALGESVAVIGCGSMGLLCLAGLRESGARQRVALDLLEERLERAAGMGATAVLNASRENIREEAEQLSGGEGFDIVIEISGRVSGLRLAAELVRQRGKIVSASLYPPESLDFGPTLMFKSPVLHITHPWYSDDINRDLRIALELFRSHVLPMDRLVTHEFPLERINEAFAIMVDAEPNFIKGLIRPWSS